MPKRCGVDGCKSGSASQRKRRALLRMKQISLFSAPTNPSQLEKWNDALVGNRTKLSSHDVVCANHFRPEDIETHYVTELTDGTKHVFERGSYRLKANAIPLSTANNAESVAQIENATAGSDLAAKDDLRSTIVVSTDGTDRHMFECLSATNKATDEDDDPLLTTTAADDNKNQKADDTKIQKADDIEKQKSDDAKKQKADDTKTHQDNNNDRYSIDLLARDLKHMNWREGWVWSSGVDSSSIEFVQFDASELQPRIHCCVSASMEITIFVGHKSTGIGMNHGTLRSFDETMALLGMMERLKTCAGTGCKEEIRAAACSGFLGDIYQKRSTSVRCPSCRAVRHNVQKRKTMDPDSKKSVLAKELYSLKRRNKILQERARKLKAKIGRSRRH